MNRNILNIKVFVLPSSRVSEFLKYKSAATKAAAIRKDGIRITQYFAPKEINAIKF